LTCGRYPHALAVPHSLSHGKVSGRSVSPPWERPVTPEVARSSPRSTPSPVKRIGKADSNSRSGVAELSFFAGEVDLERRVLRRFQASGSGNTAIATTAPQEHRSAWVKIGGFIVGVAGVVGAATGVALWLGWNPF
jgi:hypothetical protein